MQYRILHRVEFCGCTRQSCFPAACGVRGKWNSGKCGLIVSHISNARSGAPIRLWFVRDGPPSGASAREKAGRFDSAEVRCAHDDRFFGRVGESATAKARANARASADVGTRFILGWSEVRGLGLFVAEGLGG